MRLTKSQLKKIIQEELASVREAGEDVPRELLTRWVDMISELISSQHQGGKGLPLRQLPPEEKPTIIAALEDIIGQLKTEPFSEELTHANIGAARSPEEVFKSVDDSLNQAHKDLQMLSLHLKNAGSAAINEVEGMLNEVERLILRLNDMGTGVQQ